MYFGQLILQNIVSDLWITTGSVTFTQFLWFVSVFLQGEGQTFQFPEDLFSKAEEQTADEELIEEVKAKQKARDNALKNRGGLSTWFGI